MYSQINVRLAHSIAIPIYHPNINVFKKVIDKFLEIQIKSKIYMLLSSTKQVLSHEGRPQTHIIIKTA